MKRLSLLSMTLLACVCVFSIQAKAQETEYHDVEFLAECAAIFSVKASEKQGKAHPDIVDSYFEAAASFYERAVNKGGPEMKKIYDDKIFEVTNLSPNDAVGVQSKKALEKQCRATAESLDINIK